MLTGFSFAYDLIYSSELLFFLLQKSAAYLFTLGVLSIAVLFYLLTAVGNIEDHFIVLFEPVWMLTFGYFICIA